MEIPCLTVDLHGYIFISDRWEYYTLLGLCNNVWAFTFRFSAQPLPVVAH